jgi:hypothetical protein
VVQLSRRYDRTANDQIRSHVVYFSFGLFALGRNKIVLSVLVDGHVQERIFGLTPEELAGSLDTCGIFS